MPDSDNKLRGIVQSRESGKQEAMRAYASQSKERMKRNMETKIRTTMIGSLSVIEDKLGFLWGQGKPRSQLTDQELAMEELKDELRTDILNNGNNQLRAAASEINQYSIIWNKYQYGNEGRDE